MKSFKFSFSIAIIILFALLFTQNGFSQKSFEGLVKYKMTDDNENISFMKYYSKPGKVRVEIDSRKNDNEAVLIINSKKKEMTILASLEKTAISFPIDKMENDKDDVKEKHKYNITRTGETKIIHGYNSIKYIGKSKDEEIEVWVTEDLDPFLGFGKTSHEKFGWQDITGMDIKGFPLEIYNRTKGSSIIATSIEEKSFDESLFKAPTNYKHFNFKSIMKGLKILAKDLKNLFQDFKIDNFDE
jgi:hypothetical protein